MSDPFVGEVRLFANTFVPDGWLLCDGRLLQVSDPNYQILFAVIGGMYSQTQSSTSFNVPNLMGRVAIGAGQASGGGVTNYAVGNKDGVEQVTVNTSNMPPHTHQLQKKNTSVAGAAGKTAVPSLSSDLGGLSTTTSVSYNAVISNGTPNTTLTPGTLGGAGSSASHENRQPYLSLFYAIAYQGMFPVRP